MPVKKREFSIVEVKDIVLKYESGMSTLKIAPLYFTSTGTISKLLRENNVKMRDKSHAMRMYNVNENYFSKIDTQEKAYILGFVFADGYLHERKRTLKINQHVRDRDIIEKFKDQLGTDCPIRQFRDERYICIQIVNERIRDDLVSLGCVQAKSFIVEFPNISENLKKHFIRGYFDGNAGYGNYKRKKYLKGRYNWSAGAWRTFTVYVVGSQFIISSIREVITSSISGINCRVDNNTMGVDNGIKKLSIGGNLQVMAFLNWLYDGAILYGDRKYNQYLEMKYCIENERMNLGNAGNVKT